MKGRDGAASGAFELGLISAALIACGGVADSGPPTTFTHVEPAPDPPPRTMRGPDAVDPDTVPLVNIDLGEVAPESPVLVDIPAGTLGFNVVVEGAGIVGVHSLRSPTGEWVGRDHRPIGGSYASSASASGIAAMSVPQNLLASARPPVPGRWEAVFTGTPPLRASIRAQVAPGGGAAGGLLDLRVFVPRGLKMKTPTAAHVVTPEEAPADAALQARLDAFYDGLSRLFGIGRGRVSYHAIDERFLTVSSSDDLGQLYAQGARLGDAQALDVMLVRALELSPGHPLFGRAAAIPGPATHAGTRQSGIAVAILPESSPATDALVMLHEAGHYFGLNHTSELAADAFDPLDDTPRCEGLWLGKMAECPDAHNLMFPSASWSGLKVSDGQRAVVLGSPVYRQLRRPGDPPSAATWAAGDGRFESRGLLGHDGARTRVEGVLLGAMCGSAALEGDALTRALGTGARAELEAIAKNPLAAEAVRRLAQTAAQRLP